MKRLLTGLFLFGAFSLAFAGSFLYQDRQNYEIAISIDSTADSSAGGLITCAVDTIRMEEAGTPLKSLMGVLIVEPSSETLGGFGLQDSAFMALQTYGLGVAPTTLDSRGQLGLPCTLFVNLASVGDTLFHRHLQFTVQVLDSSAVTAIDTVSSPDGYTIHWELIGRD